MYLVPFARRILIKAFIRDGFLPGSFYHGYVANIACALYDCGNLRLGMPKCTEIAREILFKLFPEIREAWKAESERLSC